MPEVSWCHLLIHEAVGEKERFLCCLYKNDKITLEEYDEAML